MIDEAVEPILDEETFKKLWVEQGLKYRVEDFYSFCISRGLKGLTKENFTGKVEKFLNEFLCKGLTDLPVYKKHKPKPEWWGA